MKKLMSAVSAVVVFVFIFLASTARVEGQVIIGYADSISGQMVQYDSKWGTVSNNLGQVVGYSTTTLDFWCPNQEQGRNGIKVVSETGSPTLLISNLSLQNGFMVGKISFWNSGDGQLDPNGRYLVEAEFKESRRTPDPANPGSGIFYFSGNWKFKKGTGGYTTASSGNGVWFGYCRYKGSGKGFVDSFSFLAEPLGSYNRCRFSGSIFFNNMVQQNGSVRRMNTFLIRPIQMSVQIQQPVIVWTGQPVTEEDIPPDEDGE